MKRKNIICALMITALLLGGCAGQQSQLSYIGADRAKQLALDAASLLSSETQSITTDLSTRNGIDYYQVDIVADGERYRYDIDAFTGIVIDSSTPDAARATESTADAATDSDDKGSADDIVASDAGSGPDDTAAPGTGSPDTAAAFDAGSAANATAGSSADNGASQELITEESARSSALAHAGLTADQVTFTKSKLDHDDGRRVYEVEFRTGSSEEYDYEIDAYSGEIISYDYDLKAPSSSGSSTISEEEARGLALAQVPGASDSDIKKFKTDRDDGHIEYEGTILYDGMEYEFEIDAYSGAIRSWEAEPEKR